MEVSAIQIVLWVAVALLWMAVAHSHGKYVGACRGITTMVKMFDDDSIVELDRQINLPPEIRKIVDQELRARSMV